jgi:hypothetical protein
MDPRLGQDAGRGLPKVRQAKPDGMARRGQAQRFLSAHDPINYPFHVQREYITAAEYREAPIRAFETWAERIGPFVPA